MSKPVERMEIKRGIVGYRLAYWIDTKPYRSWNIKRTLRLQTMIGNIHEDSHLLEAGD